MYRELDLVEKMILRGEILVNKNNKQENFSDIALILGSLIFGILLTIMPLNLEKIFPLSNNK